MSKGAMTYSHLATAVLIAVGVLAVSGQPSVAAAHRTAPQEVARPSYAQLPLSFVPNAGQSDPHVRFLAQAGGASFFFARSQAVFSFTKGGRSHALALRFVNANPRASITGDQALQGRVNYLHGNDPSKWDIGLRTYGEIVYKDLWPGIDLAFRGDRGALKYEFRVRPGADPRRIQMAYAGARRLSLTGSGALALSTSLGVLNDSRPISFQRIGSTEEAVESRFVLAGGNELRFAVGAYDHRQPLVIDPGLVYSTFVGGTGNETAIGITLDAQQNAYVTGLTQSADFPVTPGAYDPTFNGAVTDAFVTKLDPSGSALVYSTFFGGTGDDIGQHVAVDKMGNAYLNGYTESPDFPVTPGAFDTTHNGNFDAYLLKLNPSGGALVYSTFLGGTAFDQSRGLVVDGSGKAYLSGNTDSTDFPTTPGAYDTTHNGGPDAFLAKLNAAGSALVYSTFLGGMTSDFGGQLAVDRQGNAYFAGSTDSPDFPTTAGAYDTSQNGGRDVFVTKLNRTGHALVYSTFLGGSADDTGWGLALDRFGNVYVSNATGSTDFPTTPGAFDTSYNGGTRDGYVTKLNPAGSALVYSTFLGGTGDNDTGRKFVVDRKGVAFLSGQTDSADFPTTTGAFDNTYNGGRDTFVAMMNASGTALGYSTFLGGSGDDFGQALAIYQKRLVYVTGSTQSADYPTTPGAFDPTPNGNADVFVTKLRLG